MSQEAAAKNLILLFRECCHAPLNMISLRKVFYHLAEMCFIDTRGFTEFGTLLSCIKYDPSDPTGSTLSIHMEGDASSNANGKSYIVILKITDWNFRKTGIDSFTAQDSAEENLAAAKMTRTFVVPGVRVSFECQGLSYDQTAAMAHVLLAFITGSKDLFHAFNEITALWPAGISVPKKKDGAEGSWIATCAFDMQLSYSVSTNFESHILKKVALDMQSSRSVDTP